MSNIKVEIGKSDIKIDINDQAIVRRYEKACGLDSEKINQRIADFLSRN